MELIKPDEPRKPILKVTVRRHNTVQHQSMDRAMPLNSQQWSVIRIEIWLGSSSSQLVDALHDREFAQQTCTRELSSTATGSHILQL